MRLLGFVAATLLLSATAAHAQSLESGSWSGGWAGHVRNSSLGINSRSDLAVRIVDGRMTGDLVTAAPLSGTGRLTGEVNGRECRMHGRLSDGAYLTLRGRCSATAFEGEYVYEGVGGRQRGEFDMSGALNASGRSRSGDHSERRPRGYEDDRRRTDDYRTDDYRRGYDERGIQWR